MYDVFMNRLDTARTKGPADALARPSQPYAVPDYDWGHAGFAAISISYNAANAFAEWLSVKTGHRYRLPSEAEWEHVARLAAGSDGVIPRPRLDSLAWHARNADGQAHAVASKRADRLGLFDLFGNAAEWVATDQKPPVTRGGSFRDDPAGMGPRSRAPQAASWTERDPQLPSSRWWLTDGPFVGFRLVRDLPPERSAGTTRR
jgi:formylglycine-generating enzyme required for sulfatase activity